MSLTTLFPIVANLSQPLTTNIVTTNFTTLPFLTLSNGTTDLPFDLPDLSLFSTDPPAFFSSNTFDSEPPNTTETITDFDYISDTHGNLDTNISSSDNVDDTTVEAINPFLANDYNWYDYNTISPDEVYNNEPYDYTAVESESVAKPEDVKNLWKWDAINKPPPIKPISYSAATDLNPYFLWLPPIACLLFLVLISLPCIFLKIRDDLRERNGKDRKYGSFKRKSLMRIQMEARLRAEDVERQAVAAARAGVSASPYSGIQYDPQVDPRSNGKKKSQGNNKATPGLVTENVLYIEENDLSKKKENGNVVSKRLAVDEPPVDYAREEILAARSSSKGEGEGDDILEVHRHSSSSGSLSPGDELAASGETSLGSSTEQVMEARAEGEEEGSEEEDEEIRAHRSGNFSTAPKTYTKFKGWNRDLYSSSSGFGPPARKTSNKHEDGGSPGGSAGKDWGMY